MSRVAGKNYKEELVAMAMAHGGWGVLFALHSLNGLVESIPDIRKLKANISCRCTVNVCVLPWLHVILILFI
jgi:hypothetical protein